MDKGRVYRNKARESFKQSGLTYDDLTRKNLQRLRNIINVKMVQGKYIRGTFRCKQRPFIQVIDSGKLYAGIKCEAFYFNDRGDVECSREVVTFNSDGFIGFAGWADEYNIKPIIEGFIEWVEELKREKNPVCVRS